MDTHRSRTPTSRAPQPDVRRDLSVLTKLVPGAKMNVVHCQAPIWIVRQSTTATPLSISTNGVGDDDDDG